MVAKAVFPIAIRQQNIGTEEQKEPKIGIEQLTYGIIKHLDIQVEIRKECCCEGLSGGGRR